MQPIIDKKQPKIGRTQLVETVKFEMKGRENKMNLADNLKKIRKENNLSQEQLAEQLGVSRQSVSKWESGQAYPEMDKVLQLAKLFNLNIDDLLNQDIKEVTSEKQSKIAINKYIDDFLSFVTKTIDMFTSMDWKTRVKCLFEQFVLCCILLVTFLIIGDIVNEILYSIISIFPDFIQNIIYSICNSAYLMFSFIFAIILIIHVFKVRYLDYYIIVKDEINSNNQDKQETTNDESKDNKNYLEKKKEKIVIRDPKHSDYRFISGMFKVLLFIVKCFAIFVTLGFCISLICFVLSTVLSFLVINTRLFFVGLVISLLACIIINIIVLILLLNFIIGKKSKKKYLMSGFIISIVLLGVGIGIGTIGITSFDYIDNINNDIYSESELTIPMKDDLVIHNHFNSEYIEEDRSDIKILYKHTKFFTLDVSYYKNNVYIHGVSADNNFFEAIRQNIKDINDKKIIDYSKSETYIYASKENIEKLKNNFNNYIEQEDNEFYDDEI